MAKANDEVDLLIGKFKSEMKVRDGDTTKTQRVRYELFRDFFLPMLDKNVDMEKRRIIRIQWIGISNGPFNKTHLVDINDNIVITVPPVMDYLSQVDKNDSAGSNYMYAKRQDANMDLGRKDKVMESQKIHNITDGFEATWEKVIEFFEKEKEERLGKPKEPVDEDAGYEL